MNITLQSTTVVAAIAATMLFPLSIAHAQAPVDYRLDTSAVTLALVMKKTAPGTFVRNQVGGAFITPNRQRIPAFSNEWLTGPTNRPTSFNGEFVTRMSATSYGNRELLNDLVALAVIQGPITGWSVVLKYNAVTNTGTYFDEDLGQDVEYTYEDYEPVLAVRKGTQIVEVPEEKANFEVNNLASASADTSSSKTTITYRNNQPMFVSTASGVYSSESAVSMSVNTPTLGLVTLNGLIFGSSSTFYWYPIAADRSTLDSINVPGITRITGLVGAEPFDPQTDSQPEDFSGPGVITGSITLGASRAVKK